MKTFSRKFWEAQYELVSSFNPVIKKFLPFDKILTGDLNDLRDTITTATSIRIFVEGVPQRDIPSPELMRNVLVEINDYGHSLVLLSNKYSKDHSYDEKLTITDEQQNAIKSFNRDLIVNVSGVEGFMRMQGNNAFVLFGNHEYECKHISIMTFQVRLEVYLPIENTSRLFVAAHSSLCDKCTIKSCIQPNTGLITMYWSWDEGLIDTPPKPYDLHNARCKNYTYVMRSLKVLGDTILAYNKALNAQPKEKERNISNVQKHREQHDISKVSYERDTTNEIIVPVHHASVVHTSKGGKHHSPVAHSVSGYWRKRSKYDDTLIFVKSFARGGSQDEKENIMKTLGMKQKVYELR